MIFVSKSNAKFNLDKLEDYILCEYLSAFLIWHIFSTKIFNFPSLGVADPPLNGQTINTIYISTQQEYQKSGISSAAKFFSVHSSEAALMVRGQRVIVRRQIWWIGGYRKSFFVKLMVQRQPVIVRRQLWWFEGNSDGLEATLMVLRQLWWLRSNSDGSEATLMVGRQLWWFGGNSEYSGAAENHFL